ncbi:33973_t:CDS:1, partial [Racocetra persica]
SYPKKKILKKPQSKPIIISDSEGEGISNKKPKIKSESSNLHELEIEERKIILKECTIAIREKELDIRKKEAEVEALELENKKMRNELEHVISKRTITNSIYYAYS